MNDTMRFVKELPSVDTRKPVKLYLEPTLEQEWELLATDGTTVMPMLGIRANGTIVLYAGQRERLVRLGFQVSPKGFVKIYNSLEEL